MLFNRARSIRTMEVKNYKTYISWKSAVLVAYPLFILSGFALRVYWGDVSIANLQSTSERFYIPCIFHWLTSLDCPGCGITRSLMAIYLWEPVVSFYFHPLGPVLYVVSFLCWLSFVSEFANKVWVRLESSLRKHSYSVLAVAVAWGILRNF